MTSNLAKQFLLKNDVVFLNHGSFGACPKSVFQAYQEWQLKLEQQPVDFLHPLRHLTRRMGDVRTVLGERFGTAGENLVGVTNATAGLNIIAQSLALKLGDEILTSTHEYSAMYKTWHYVAARAGAEIVEAETPLPLVDETQFTQGIISRFTDKTKILFLSHITSETALVFPIKGAIEAAKERDIVTVIDGAHVPGHIPLDLDDLGADFYVGNCHKWLMAPKSSAFLYAAPHMQSKIDPLVISHGWTGNDKAGGAEGAFGNSLFVDGVEMQGTQDPSAWLSVPEAMKFAEKNDWQQVGQDCQDLAQETARRVAELTGLPALSSAQYCAPQMVSMPIDHPDPPALNLQLLDQFGIEIPVFNWRGQAIVRLSVQGYNTVAQMDVLVGALKELLKL